MSAPVIETARLLLRPHRAGDLVDSAAMWADPVVTRFISGRPFSREEVWARLLRYAGHWLWLEFGFWAVEEKATGAFIGELGFAEFEREMEPRLGAPEAGWVLAPRFHGQGYAEEALAAALAWADTRFPVTACLIQPENVASIRLGEKCGYVESARTVYKGSPTLVLHRSASNPVR
jgi:RimJ/RimL family protein N-acetyltransferase